MAQRTPANAFREIGPDRVAGLIRRLNAFGRSPGGGICRPGYGSEEAEARNWVARELAALGATVEVDRGLNLFGWLRMEGPAEGVCTGSHLDSVPDGGQYDGVLGVACGLVALEALRAALPPGSAPAGLAVFACEESSRFTVGCLGSRFATGQLDRQAAEQIRDAAGESVAGALAALGGRPDLLDGTPHLPPALSAFIEVHVDQGPELAEAGTPVGVVTHIIGPAKLRATFCGRASHAGATPRAHRRDALQGAIGFLHAAYERLAASPEAEVRLTAGSVRVEPNVVNVVPAAAEIGLDLRCASLALRDQWIEALRDSARRVGEGHGLEAGVEVLTPGGVYACPDWLVRELEEAARRCGVASRRMVSFAGHDARVLGDVVPAGMLLVANPAGISHSPLEAVDMEAAAAAARVLAATMLAVAACGRTIPHGD